MALTVLLGGARSGKSSAAQSLAAGIDRPVTYLATAQPGDDEMTVRIDRHQEERPAEWATREEPLELRQAFTAIPDDETVIVDCLTLWLNNMMGNGAAEPDILQEAEAAAKMAAVREGETIAVTNEVGLGIVPPSPLGRQFRDVAGRVNRIWVEHSHRTGFVVAGRVLPLVSVSDWKEMNR